MSLQWSVPAIVVLSVGLRCEAGAIPRTMSGIDMWTPPQLRDDVSSFVFTSSELKSSPRVHSSSVAAIGSEEVRTSGLTISSSIGLLAATSEDSEDSSTEHATWEATFSMGMLESKALLDVEAAGVGSWTTDVGKSGGTVPSKMLVAEDLLQAAEEAPTGVWRQKTAERALQIYYHAKWLAEKNYASAAEYRYREVVALARQCRRSVLASHSLARLGYYLAQWKREEEAAVVLKESMEINLKSNPLAPFLYGVLERKMAGGDVERLKLAEQHILNADEQPSDELESTRAHLMSEIAFWREAEASFKNCFASDDSAHVLICLLTHAVSSVHTFLFK